MNLILSLFTQYLKPILIGITGLVGAFFLFRAEDLEAENQILNNTLEDENKTIEKQNAAMQAVNDAKPTDIAGVTKLMREDKL